PRIQAGTADGGERCPPPIEKVRDVHDLSERDDAVEGVIEGEETAEVDPSSRILEVEYALQQGGQPVVGSNGVSDEGVELAAARARSPFEPVNQKERT